MTKAFTSALGYGVTVRGYIDEDDRLVLLEPEGGGGGDVTTVRGAITVSGSYTEIPTVLRAAAMDTESGYIMPVYIELTTESPSEIEALAGSVFFIDDVMPGTTIHVSGAEAVDEDVYAVTGDFTITCTYGE